MVTNNTVSTDNNDDDINNINNSNIFKCIVRQFKSCHSHFLLIRKWRSF